MTSRGAKVRTVPVEELYGIRRDVLRSGTPSNEVRWAFDNDAATWHLAIHDEAGGVIAASTWTPRPSPDRPGERAVQLRGMAVRPENQGSGLGGEMLAAGIVDARRRGFTVVWANARDTALAFYVANGFTVVGDGFRTPDTDLPHHRILQLL